MNHNPFGIMRKLMSGADKIRETVVAGIIIVVHNLIVS
jgi:hypothetical protein